MPAPRAPKVFRFGPDDCLVATITDPANGCSEVGAIVWGMGVAEVRIARALARLGIVALQIRQKERAFARLDSEGVRYCKAAMEVLAEKRGVENFVLMGNCGKASICFHTALQDRRVSGLILTNPHVSEALTVSTSFKRRLLSKESWRKLITGEFHLGYHLAAARKLKTLILGRILHAEEKDLIATADLNRDLTLPDRIPERLVALAARGVRILLAFSQKDEGLGYFRTQYGKSFEKLSAVPGVSVEVLPTDAHVLSLDDSASGALAKFISRWASERSFTTPTIAQPSDRRRIAAAADRRRTQRSSSERRSRRWIESAV